MGKRTVDKKRGADPHLWSVKVPMKFIKPENLENENTRAGCPRRFEIMRAESGDSEPAERDAIGRHIEMCQSCRAIWESFRRRREAFLEDHPSGPTFARLTAEADRRLNRRRQLMRLVPAVAAVTGFMVLAVILVWPSPPKYSIRTKGDVSIRFHVLRDDQVEPGVSGEAYKEGDRIQFEYTSGANRYLFLVSLDDSGRVSNFNYQSSQTSVPIIPGGGLQLEGSIILDDSPYPERVFAIFSNRPLDLENVKRAARRAYDELKKENGSVKDLRRLPLDLPQATVLIIKE